MNKRKHGVAFELARLAFADPQATEEPDEFIDEERFKLIGMAIGKLLLVVYASRQSRHRIISARKANRDEERRYFGLAT